MKIYIDCGFHLGEGAMKHIAKWDLNSNSKIIGFEANPNTYSELQRIINTRTIPDDRYSFLLDKNFEVHNKAVWNQNGVVEMYCTKIDIDEELMSNSEFIAFMELHDTKVKNGDLVTSHQGRNEAIDGSSTIFGRRNSKFLHKKGNITQKKLNFAELVQVEAIDFAEYLNLNFSDSDEIYIKMDIEGAEFKVLTRLLSTGAIKKVSRLDIEWHDFGSISLRLQKLYLKWRIASKNIEISEWE